MATKKRPEDCWCRIPRRGFFFSAYGAVGAPSRPKRSHISNPVSYALRCFAIKFVRRDAAERWERLREKIAALTSKGNKRTASTEANDKFRGTESRVPNLPLAASLHCRQLQSAGEFSDFFLSFIFFFLFISLSLEARSARACGICMRYYNNKINV
jgi:hypothetical protein